MSGDWGVVRAQGCLNDIEGMQVLPADQFTLINDLISRGAWKEDALHLLEAALIETVEKMDNSTLHIAITGAA